MRSLRHILALTTGCALSAVIGIHGLIPPANAITTEQLLFLEAWRAIDRAYVDKSFNNQSWFRVSFSSLLPTHRLRMHSFDCKHSTHAQAQIDTFQTSLLSCSYVSNI